MSERTSGPLDPRLADVIRRLEGTCVPVELYDAEWRLVWISDELKNSMNEHDEDKLGVGLHMIEAVCLNEVWVRKITPESYFQLALDMTPMQISDTPGGRRALADMGWRALSKWEHPVHLSREDFDGFFFQIPEVPPPPVFLMSYGLSGPQLPEEVECYAVRLHDDAGEFFGTLFLSTPKLSARLVALLTRGDISMFERMARLYEPGRRQAAMLFADLEGSGALSRRLPSAGYFRLISELTTQIDRIVAERGGVVGKHAGDGVSAFFLVDELGSGSRAARAAIEAGREIREIAPEIAKRVAGETSLVNGSDMTVNVAVHWGATLYMGQLVTGGRLEVTALGDEVNECARMQETARDGEAIASKTLIEHLSADDAQALGLDLEAVRYLSLSEVPSASAKAVRDAGGIAVTTL